MKLFVQALITAGLAGIFIVQIVALKPQYDRARAVALNEIDPTAFNELLMAVEYGQPLDRSRITAYLRYFQDVSRLSPERADAIGLQGLCYYLLGDYNRAASSYDKAVGLLPFFFGFHYNLAVIHYQRQNYGDAARELQLALSSDPKQSWMYIISSSKIYAYLMLARANVWGVPVADQVARSYQKAGRLMAATQYRLQTGKSLPDEQIAMETF